MKRVLLTIQITALAVLVMFSANAYATLTLTFSDGANSISFNDSGSPGSITTGSFSLDNFVVNHATVDTEPAVPGEAFFDVGSYDATSTLGGTLTITVQDTNLNLPNGTGILDILNTGGVSRGSATEISTVSLGSQIFPALSGFSVEQTYDTIFSNPFSLTEVIRLTLNPSTRISLDNTVTLTDSSVPEPSTYLLFSAGLLALAAFRRRSQKALLAVNRSISV